MATKMVTSIGKGEDAGELGKSLVCEVKEKLGGVDPGFAMLYASSRLDLEKLLKAVRKELGGTPLIGCTTAGEFTETDVLKESVALSIVSASDDYQFHVAVATGLKENPEACVQKVVNAIPSPPEDYAHRSALLLHDGLAGKGEEAVLSAVSILGPKVNFAGGSAADDLAFKQTYVFCNDEITTDSVALCVIDSKKPVAIGVKHGHLPVTGQLTVTKAVDNVLYEVNGQPAWEVWKREMAQEAKTIGIDVEKLSDDSEVGQFLIRYELGLTTGSEYKVRVPLSKNEDGSLNFACTIPEGAGFCIMKSPEEAQIASAEQAAKYAQEQMGDNKTAGVFVFDCVCRGIILGDKFFRGVDAIKKVVGDVSLIGFETYGEICRRPGQMSGLHNTTTVVMLLPA